MCVDQGFSALALLTCGAVLCMVGCSAASPACTFLDTSGNTLISWSESHSVASGPLWPHGLYSPWNSPGQNTGVSSLSLLQGIFPTQGSNSGLPHCRRILYQLSHQVDNHKCLQNWSSVPWGQNQPQLSMMSIDEFTF